MNSSFDPKRSYDKVFSDYFRELPSLSKVRQEKEKKQTEIDKKIQELRNSKSGFAGSTANIIKKTELINFEPLLHLLGRNVTSVHSSIETQMILESDIEKLKEEFKKLNAEEIRLKNQCQYLEKNLENAYKDYLENPSTENGKKVQAAINEIFQEDTKAAKELKEQIKKISISNQNQGKLHNLMLMHINAPRIVDLPSNLLQNIILHLNKSDIENFMKAHHILQTSVEDFFNGKNPHALLEYVEKNSENLNRQEKLLLLKNCKSALTHVDLTDLKPEIKDVKEFIASCPNLEEMLMPTYSVTQNGLKEGEELEEFTKLNKLQKLQIFLYGDLHKLSPPLPKLKSLELTGGTNISDEGLKHLTQFSSLEHLAFYHNESKAILTLEGVKQLKNLANLRSLSLYIFDNTILNGISALQQLKKLYLEKTKYTTPSFPILNISEIGKLSNLEELKLKYFNLTEDEMKIFSMLNNLKTLNLQGCTFPSSTIHYLNSNTLKELNVSQTIISDGDLKDLTNLSNLENLDLSNCFQITSAGLAHLKNLPNLKKVNLSGCLQLSRQALADLSSKGITVLF